MCKHEGSRSIEKNKEIGRITSVTRNAYYKSMPLALNKWRYEISYLVPNLMFRVLQTKVLLYLKNIFPLAVYLFV
jgi:hypothetical protein